MATTISSHILLIDLSDGESPRVLRRFDHHRARNLVGGQRIIKGPKLGTSVPNENGHSKSELHVPESDDIDMDGVPREEMAGRTVATVSRLAISADGQWLATTDDLSRTYIFNLDSVQVRASTIPSFISRSLN